MKKVILILAVLVLIGSQAMAAPPVSVVLVDNTLVTSAQVLSCMKKADTQQVLELTGTIGDTFVIYQNGIPVINAPGGVTVTLVTTSEFWDAFGGISSFKVDATFATSGTMNLICYKPEQP